MSPTTNHLISLKTAIELTSRFRSQKENILSPQFKGQNILPNCETFDRKNIDQLLGQHGCVSIRIYYGMDDSSKQHCILVAVNEQGEDILPATNVILIEEGIRCPPICPPPSPLNLTTV